MKNMSSGQRVAILDNEIESFRKQSKSKRQRRGRSPPSINSSVIDRPLQMSVTGMICRSHNTGPNLICKCNHPHQSNLEAVRRFVETDAQEHVYREPA
jgi:hypothetical protein